MAKRKKFFDVLYKETKESDLKKFYWGVISETKSDARKWFKERYPLCIIISVTQRREPKL